MVAGALADDQVKSIAQALGIYDLTQFTPDVTAYEPPQ